MGLTVVTRRPIDLAAVATLALLLDAVVLLFPESPLRVALGLPFVLFLPGYALVAALFPERHREYEVPRGEDGLETEQVSEGIDALERVALSLGLSIAVVPLLGLGLNYTPWGIRLTPILATVTAFTLAACAAAWWRRLQLPEDERLAFHLHVEPPDWASYTPLDKALTVALVVSVVAAAGALAYVVTTPRPGEAFTEFYVLGPGGKAEDYPLNLTVNETGSVILGVRNHEHTATRYVVEAWLEASANGTGANRTVTGLYFLQRWNVTLDPVPAAADPGAAWEPQWEAPWNFTMPDEGRWRLRLVLFAEGHGGAPLAPAVSPGADYAGSELAARLDQAYRSLHLWVTVAPA